MKLAKVNFYKDVEKDNYFEGITPELTSIDFQQIEFTFETEDELLYKMSRWVYERFDVDFDEYLKYVNNDCDDYRFDYNQNEDDDGSAVLLSADNPDGYLAHYQMLVLEVFEIELLDYKFKRIGDK